MCHHSGQNLWWTHEAQRRCTAIVLLINLLFGGVLVAVAVVACSSSLISIFKRYINTNFKNLSHTVGISYVSSNFFEPISIIDYKAVSSFLVIIYNCYLRSSLCR